MSQELLADRLTGYFAHEAARGEISADAWQRMVSEAVTHRQRRWGQWLRLPVMTSRRPVAAAAGVAVALAAGGVSLWVSQPWQEDMPAGPRGGPGPRGVIGRGGMPAPHYFDASWSTKSKTYLPGEAITVALSLLNKWDQPIRLDVISSTPLLDLVDSPVNEMIPLPPASITGLPEQIDPGEAVTLFITIGPEITSNLPTGRYTVRQELRIYPPDKPFSTMSFGMSPGTLFVIVPPEGALEKTVQVNEARQSGDITMRLESVSFGAEETKIVAFAALPNSGPAAGGAQSPAGPAPVPTATSAPDRTPTPTAVPTAPPAIGGNIQNISARYRIDGGPWQDIAVFGYGGPLEAMRLEWMMGPVSATAQTFEFEITGVQISGAEDVTGLWGWSVPLQDE